MQLQCPKSRDSLSKTTQIWILLTKIPISSLSNLVQTFLGLTTFMALYIFPAKSSRNQSGTLPPVKLVVLARGGTSFKIGVRGHKREGR